ncbi:iron-sulfur cluster-binding protein [Campylobacter pinnipediorum subsp. caledonicus]|uniref:LutB/LldF family L-lactate oxidation iron-sulfur protein n=1 Tax=Campylobacter pinnipediorum TaxID=1965231 RepID=UPI000994B3AD|nr:LutB/LldF family L-lactate oxidation iron-sulfur protein [Campylobacter pinnipediorum]OPA72017.1 iron-sulfur cluster-binding protein [Campylobacter pinnipediorum subsp. caledonicus]
MNNHKNIVNISLNDQQLRKNLGDAMHLLQGNRARVIENKYNNWQEQRHSAKHAKNNSLYRLDERLLKFEEKAKKNGWIVHWANTGDDVCEIVYQLMLEKGADKVIKQKSMASEEVGLNHYLEKRGKKSLETDLGEVIIQLVDEKPVHIVVPAIHKNRYQVGEIFHEKIGAPLENEPEKLNAIARDYMRQHFKTGTIGICGANFAIAEEGAIWLVENEGNGRMSTTIPDVLVSICGIEKVCDTIEDASNLVGLLTPSATGQFIANYNNIISGPRREGELDGPKECHIILFDNHRTNMLAHEDYYEALRCIRCGACMNFCPVYDKISGHSYQSVYPGPIGAVISPQIFGMDINGDVVSLCSLCGRCSEVCPVEIPLADLIRKLRRDKVGDGKNPPYGADNINHSAVERMGFKGFTMVATSGFMWRTAMTSARIFNGLIQSQGKNIPVLKLWFEHKDLPLFNFNTNDVISKMEGVIYE